MRRGVIAAAFSYYNLKFLENYVIIYIENGKGSDMGATIEELNIANEIVKEYFDRKLFQCTTLKEIDEWVANNRNWLNAHAAHIYHGLTKIVIDDPDLVNWVIKITFYREAQVDFMKLEYKNYIKAKESGYAQFFAETVWGGEIEGCGFYLQERCYNNEGEKQSTLRDYSYSISDREPDETEEEYEDRLTSEEDEYEDEDNCRAFLGDTSIVENLIEWLYDNDINDLHMGNFGQRADGNYIIFDFSGFC